MHTPTQANEGQEAPPPPPWTDKVVPNGLVKFPIEISVISAVSAHPVPLNNMGQLENQGMGNRMGNGNGNLHKIPADDWDSQLSYRARD